MFVVLYSKYYRTSKYCFAGFAFFSPLLNFLIMKYTRNIENDIIYSHMLMTHHLFRQLQDERGDGTKAWDMCLDLKEKGLLAKPTHGKRGGSVGRDSARRRGYGGRGVGYSFYCVTCLVVRASIPAHPMLLLLRWTETRRRACNTQKFLCKARHNLSSKPSLLDSRVNFSFACKEPNANQPMNE